MNNPNLPAPRTPIPPALAHARDLLIARARTQGLPRKRRPAHNVLLLDASGSMDGEKLNEMLSGCENAVATALEKGDSVSLIQFGAWVDFVATKVSSREDARRAMTRVKADGGTPMKEAIALARKALQGQGRGLIHLITDGFPDDRSGTLSEGKAAIAEGHVIRCTAVYGADQAFLDELAGGEEEKQVVMTTPRNLAKAIERNTMKALPF